MAVWLRLLDILIGNSIAEVSLEGVLKYRVMTICLLAFSTSVNAKQVEVALSPGTVTLHQTARDFLKADVDYLENIVEKDVNRWLSFVYLSTRFRDQEICGKNGCMKQPVEEQKQRVLRFIPACRPETILVSPTAKKNEKDKFDISCLLELGYNPMDATQRREAFKRSVSSLQKVIQQKFTQKMGSKTYKAKSKIDKRHGALFDLTGQLDFYGIDASELKAAKRDSLRAALLGVEALFLSVQSGFSALFTKALTNALMQKKTAPKWIPSDFNDGHSNALLFTVNKQEISLQWELCKRVESFERPQEALAAMHQRCVPRDLSSKKSEREQAPFAKLIIPGKTESCSTFGSDQMRYKVSLLDANPTVTFPLKLSKMKMGTCP